MKRLVIFLLVGLTILLTYNYFFLISIKSLHTIPTQNNIKCNMFPIGLFEIILRIAKSYAGMVLFRNDNLVGDGPSFTGFSIADSDASMPNSVHGNITNTTDSNAPTASLQNYTQNASKNESKQNQLVNQTGSSLLLDVYLNRTSWFIWENITIFANCSYNASPCKTFIEVYNESGLVIAQEINKSVELNLGSGRYNVSITGLYGNVSKVIKFEIEVKEIEAYAEPKAVQLNETLLLCCKYKRNVSVTFRVGKGNVTRNITAVYNLSHNRYEALYRPNRTGNYTAFCIVNNISKGFVFTVYLSNVTENKSYENITMPISTANKSLNISVNITANITKPMQINLTLKYKKPKHSKIIIGKPVEWNQEVVIENPTNETVTKTLTFDIPKDAFNVTFFFKNHTTMLSNITLQPFEKLKIRIRFYTAPVKILMQEVDLNLLELLPPEARNIKIYKHGVLAASYPNIKQGKVVVPGMEKRIYIYHNSSLHYHNITVRIPVSARNITFIERVNGSNVARDVRIENGTVIWNIERLSSAEAIVRPKVVRMQGKAVIGKPVKWQTIVGNFSIEYETPAPVKMEKLVGSVKRVIIEHNASVHYHNVTAYSELPDMDYKPKIYRVVNGTRIDITASVIYNVTYLDRNKDGLYDRIEWIVPMLSNDTYEIEIVILNVQSYPTVGGNWTVRFNT
ncbi:MAG TPA: hypothetical protein ENG42_01480, partial [Candidatus Aenigmarchaeota archaeon]|nr:hypothetical protein [Candidatus Aenigmarchaeota archaeon]